MLFCFFNSFFCLCVPYPYRRMVILFICFIKYLLAHCIAAEDLHQLLVLQAPLHELLLTHLPVTVHVQEGEYLTGFYLAFVLQVIIAQSQPQLMLS